MSGDGWKLSRIMCAPARLSGARSARLAGHKWALNKRDSSALNWASRRFAVAAFEMAQISFEPSRLGGELPLQPLSSDTNSISDLRIPLPSAACEN